MTINPGKKQQLYIIRESNGQKDHDTALPALFIKVIMDVFISSRTTITKP